MMTIRIHPIPTVKDPKTMAKRKYVNPFPISPFNNCPSPGIINETNVANPVDSTSFLFNVVVLVNDSPHNEHLSSFDLIISSAQKGHFIFNISPQCLHLMASSNISSAQKLHFFIFSFSRILGGLTSCMVLRNFVFYFIRFRINNFYLYDLINFFKLIFFYKPVNLVSDGAFKLAADALKPK